MTRQYRGSLVADGGECYFDGFVLNDADCLGINRLLSPVTSLNCLTKSVGECSGGVGDEDGGHEGGDGGVDCDAWTVLDALTMKRGYLKDCYCLRSNGDYYCF